MNKDNNLGRVLALLSLTLLMSFGLYSLPDTLFGYKIKKVDLLSDFKVKEEKLSLDSLKQQLEQADTLQVDSVALRDSIMRSAGIILRLWPFVIRYTKRSMLFKGRIRWGLISRTILLDISVCNDFSPP